MLKSRNVVLALAGAVSLAFTASLFTTYSVQSQQDQSDAQTATVSKKSTQPGEQKLDDEATPLVEYAPSTKTPVDEERRQKNKRHDGRDVVSLDVDPRAGEAVVHSEVFVPDLPFELSDLIVEGTVTDSNAFLSEDKTGIYSEFTISVTDVLKSSQSVSVNKHDVITTERFGGRVRFPSGQTVRYKVSGTGSPRRNVKYLLFLRTMDDGNYRIITAYEMRGGKVLALDGSRIDYIRGGEPVFDKHNGKEWQYFLEEVRKALKEVQ